MKPMLIFAVLILMVTVLITDVEARAPKTRPQADICPQVITKVCGDNGMTYTFRNPCTIRLPRGVSLDHLGAC